MAIKKTIELNVKTDSKTAEKSLDEIEKGLKDIKREAEKSFADEPLKKFNREADKTLKVSTDVRQKLRDIQNKMAEIGDVGSAEFQALAREAGKFKDQMNNANAAIRSMSADFPRLQIGVQALGLLGASAGAATAGMALLGSENENVARSLQQMMAITTLMSSVTQVSNMLSDESAIGLKIRTIWTNLKASADNKSTSALVKQSIAQKAVNMASKAFNAIMKMNPIGLIVLAITALIAAGYALVKMFNIFGEEQESAADSSARLTAELEKQDKAMEKANAKRKLEHAQKMRRLDIEKASEKDRLNAVLGNLDAEQKARREELEVVKKNLKDRRVAEKQAWEEQDFETAKAIRDELATTKDRYNQLVIEVKSHKENVLATTQEGNAKINAEEEATHNERVARYKEYLSKRKAAEDTHLAVLRELKAHEISLIDDDFKREQAVIQNNFKIKREDLLANESITAEDKAKLRSAYNTQEQISLDELHQKKLEDARAKANELADASKPPELGDLTDPNSSGLIEIEAEEIKGQRLFDIKKKWQDATDEMLDISESKAFERRAKGLENASGALNSLNDLNTALTDAAVAKAGDNEAEAEKARKKGFERSKKMQIGMAIIQGIQGTMAAFTAGSSMGPAGVVMGPLMAGLAAATSVVNIAKIAKTQYQSGGGADMPDVARGVSSVPTFNIAGNSTENQLAQSLGQQEMKPIKAMVVSTEVTTAQSLDRNKIDTATL